MIAAVSLRLNHALQECLTNALSRSTAPRQPAALFVVCARLRDWQQPVGIAELADFVGGDLQAWQGRLGEGKKQEEDATLDRQISENLSKLEF